MNSDFMSMLTPYIKTITPIVVNLITVMGGCYVVALLTKKSILRQSKTWKILDPTITPILIKCSNISIYLVGLVILLEKFHFDPTGLIALLGSLGIAIGLALKDTIGNIASGIMILALRPFKVGDSVEYSNFSGKVTAVGLFTTTLETADGIFISSPNNVLWSNSIKNYSKNEKRRFEIVVGIGYDDSIDTAFEILNKIVSAETRILDDPAPLIAVQSMGDNSVNIQVRAWTKVTDFWVTYWDTQKAVKEQIEKGGLNIPYPQRDIRIINQTTK